MEHSINFTCKARYFTSGDKGAAKQIWFVLHGYGQLAKYFLRKFLVLEKYGIYVIAPEGLSRFYLEDIDKRMQSGDQRVGATWMTRENRLTDIENYINLLNSIYKHEVADCKLPVTILGFSQGAATATRWAINGIADFQRLILWAGVFPPDVDLTHGKEALENKKIIMVYGDKDPFITDNRFLEMKDLSSRLGIIPQEIKFSGKHDIEEDALLKLV